MVISYIDKVSLLIINEIPVQNMGVHAKFMVDLSGQLN